MKATRKKVLISLYVDAIEALADLATERKRGEFLSQLIRDAYQHDQQPVDFVAPGETQQAKRATRQAARQLRSIAKKLDYLGD